MEEEEKSLARMRLFIQLRDFHWGQMEGARINALWKYADYESQFTGWWGERLSKEEVTLLDNGSSQHFWFKRKGK